MAANPAAPFILLGLDHVVLRVRDPERLERFYCEALGCRLERRQEKIGLVQLRAGRSLIDLVDLAGPLGAAGGGVPTVEARNMDHFCLRIEPFDAGAIRAHLIRHGVEPGAVESRYGAEGEGPSLYLKDPEGNEIELKGPPAR
ncbi:MAG TPA: VOC family protein [Hypericibacter adhaerens]|jgi:catechol 2,3-dioxygenase-like lactoylglutathione lyase family enzyme|uniref:Lactoylglutathione lyase n=1 Tax=Hypericibacter adhaerens TaxID=2602016 RepID=A0A5J6MZ57_9PROT|nr:VOC family protein [Hypericibacter adhaerens]QEX22809.1 lactoylglutathione lyase [Hypericibacter adhaerens]HWA44958.1 VOC family protein [Hypericibacter adhaerens]